MHEDNTFAPTIRFAVVSDIHLKDERAIEHENFEKAISTAYRLSNQSDSYKNLDAFVIVGDFANKGTEKQMLAAKSILDNGIDYDKTKAIISVASHEYMTDGVEPAYNRLRTIFNSEPDTHNVINGFHFISVSPSHSCNFNEQKKSWIAAELDKASQEDRKKPIFMFQHPHNTGTVYGSILWGEDDLISTYMNYPQIIDFSGHSHAPINDPRSVHQQHFTSFGTGTLSYFELDEFDKICGTIPYDKPNAAQMLIVEADENNRVRVYPYDLVTDNYFPYIWKIDIPSDPSTFQYTSKRYKTDICPYFDKNDKITASAITNTSFKIEFNQAKISKDYVNSYDITVRDDKNNIVKQLSIWSDYFFYDMPKTRSVTVEGLKSGKEYKVSIFANSFWYTQSKNNLETTVKTK